MFWRCSKWGWNTYRKNRTIQTGAKANNTKVSFSIITSCNWNNKICLKVTKPWPYLFKTLYDNIVDKTGFNGYVQYVGGGAVLLVKIWNNFICRLFYNLFSTTMIKILVEKRLSVEGVVEVKLKGTKFRLVDTFISKLLFS